VIFLAIELKNPAVELLTGGFKRLSKLANHVSIENLSTIFRREDEVSNQSRDAVSPSPIVFLHTHLRNLVAIVNM
jgi:hypothetical protein